MGRRARFKVLDQALKYLRSSDAGTAPDAPASSYLGKYQAYKKGSVNVTYTRAADSSPGEMKEFIVKLFGLGATDNTALCRASARALAAPTGITETDLGLAAAGTPWAFEGDFIPARAICRITSGTASAETSKITGRPYKAKSSNSYTLPFGQGASATNYVAQCKALANKVDGTGKSVSFLPEDILDVL